MTNTIYQKYPKTSIPKECIRFTCRILHSFLNEFQFIFTRLKSSKLVGLLPKPSTLLLTKRNTLS